MFPLCLTPALNEKANTKHSFSIYSTCAEVGGVLLVAGFGTGGTPEQTYRNNKIQITTSCTILQPSTGHDNITQTSVHLCQCEIPFWLGQEPQNRLPEHQELKDPPLWAARTKKNRIRYW